MATSTKRRRYSDNDKATALAALDANEGNLYRTAKQLGISISTLQSWTNVSEDKAEELAPIRNRKRKELHEVLRDLAYQIADVIPDKLNDANLQHTSVSLGIVLEKMQLLEGKATERVEHSISDEERASRVATLLDAARNRRDGSPTSDEEYVQ